MCVWRCAVKFQPFILIWSILKFLKEYCINIYAVVEKSCYITHTHTKYGNKYRFDSDNPNGRKCKHTTEHAAAYFCASFPGDSSFCLDRMDCFWSLLQLSAMNDLCGVAPSGSAQDHIYYFPPWKSIIFSVVISWKPWEHWGVEVIFREMTLLVIISIEEPW